MYCCHSFAPLTIVSKNRALPAIRCRLITLVLVLSPSYSSDGLQIAPRCPNTKHHFCANLSSRTRSVVKFNARKRSFLTISFHLAEFQSQAAVARQFRDAGLPFVIKNYEPMNTVRKLWTFEYLRAQFSNRTNRVERCPHQHFIYWDAKKAKRYRARNLPWTEPTTVDSWTFDQWAAHQGLIPPTDKNSSTTLPPHGQ